MWYSMAGLPRYLRDLAAFRRQYQGALRWQPCLQDWKEEGGTTKNEYFIQDLFVARKIFLSNPTKHVDIGSRIDGFVAHVASFREIEVFDVRPVRSNVPGIVFTQADLATSGTIPADYCDSLSCLHALEHFGLGRYGDPINAQGYVTGLQNMAKMLKLGGTLYLSLPVGRELVAFNAHRVFNPQSIVQLAESLGLRLESFSWTQPGWTHFRSGTVAEIDVQATDGLWLGLFIFQKK
jgi:hypothetical protein